MSVYRYTKFITAVVPLPATLPLFALGIGLLGLSAAAGRRRRTPE